VPIAFLASWLRSQRPVQPEQFTTPVLLTHPGDDRWTPENLSLTFLQRITAETTYVELDNCGHFPVEEPGSTAMVDAARTFIEQAAGASTVPE
jgi:pimeloyl-ACP methyl ester carboxylesterase